MAMVETKFKHTDIGLIPEDWEVKELKEVLKFGSGKDYKLLKTGNVPVYGTGGIMTFVDEYLYDGDSVGIGRKGTIDKPVFLTGKFWTVDTLFYTHSFSLCIPKYIFYKFCRIHWKEYNEASGVPSLNKNTLAQILIALPPLPEQQAIVEVLSDTDNWIESLEKLIAKKQLIKQGAMQQLLTPREGWEVKKLGNIGKTYGGLSGKTKQDFGTGDAHYLPFLNIINNVVINKDFIEKVNIKQNEYQNKVLRGDVLFNGSSETPEELGISSVLLNEMDNLYLNSFCFGFRLFDEKINPLFLSYLMRSSYGRSTIFFLAQGATRYNLSKSNFLELEISFPLSEEQTQIATILSDMDDEIEALEQKLTKAKQIKQGLMQELLTGRIRLA